MAESLSREDALQLLAALLKPREELTAEDGDPVPLLRQRVRGGWAPKLSVDPWEFDAAQAMLIMIAGALGMAWQDVLPGGPLSIFETKVTKAVHALEKALDVTRESLLAAVRQGAGMYARSGSIDAAVYPLACTIDHGNDNLVERLSAHFTAAGFPTDASDEGVALEVADAALKVAGGRWRYAKERGNRLHGAERMAAHRERVGKSRKKPRASGV